MTAGMRVIVFTVRLLPGMRPAGDAFGGLIPAFYRYGPLDEHFLGKENPGLGGENGSTCL